MNQLVTYHIKDWNSMFEDYRSREVEHLLFVKFPVRRHGEVFSTLMQTKGGIAAYGVFCALVSIAASCPKRGTLTDEKGPWTAERFARRFNAPKALVTDAFLLLSSPEVGWLTTDDAPSEHRPPTAPMQTEDTPAPNTSEEQPQRGAAAPARPSRPWEDLFAQEWSKRHEGQKYPWQGAKDGQAMGRIRKHFNDNIEAFRPVLARYLDDSIDSFNIKHGHGVAWLWNKLAAYLTESSVDATRPIHTRCDTGAGTDASAARAARKKADEFADDDLRPRVTRVGGSSNVHSGQAGAE